MKKKKYNARKVGGFTLVSSGLLGQEKDIIVDDVYNPKMIFGICDGKGDFVNSTKKKKNYVTKSLYKVLKKEINFL